jgi:dihydrofolate reductase
MRLSLIVAFASNGVIGCGGKLPWHLSDDLRRFRRLTMGHPIIMGRKTFESIGRPLPGRASIVISRYMDVCPEGVRMARSLAESFQLARSSDEAFVIGGGQVFAAALPFAHRLYLTSVQGVVEGDTFFPPWDASQWRVVSESWHAADANHTFPFQYRVCDRIDGCPEELPWERQFPVRGMGDDHHG